MKKVGKALKDVGGASTEYQHVIVELKGLESALQTLEALEPTEDDVSHINAIRGMALACQLPLRDFLGKLERYRATLGPPVFPNQANRLSFRGVHHKAKWAISLTEDVERLRALVAAKVVGINLLLVTHSSWVMIRSMYCSISRLI